MQNKRCKSGNLWTFKNMCVLLYNELKKYNIPLKVLSASESTNKYFQRNFLPKMSVPARMGLHHTNKSICINTKNLQSPIKYLCQLHLAQPLWQTSSGIPPRRHNSKPGEIVVLQRMQRHFIQWDVNKTVHTGILPPKDNREYCSKGQTVEVNDREVSKANLTYTPVFFLLKIWCLNMISL